MSIECAVDHLVEASIILDRLDALYESESAKGSPYTGVTAAAACNALIGLTVEAAEYTIKQIADARKLSVAEQRGTQNA